MGYGDLRMIVCEHDNCNSVYEHIVYDFLIRDNPSTGKTDIQQYGPKHFFCGKHLRMSLTFQGHPKASISHEANYFRNQIKYGRKINGMKGSKDTSRRKR